MLQIERLDLSGMKLGDDGLAATASCVTNIDELNIGNENDTEITIKGIRAIAQGISKRDKPVSYQQGVYFSYNEKFSCIS